MGSESSGREASHLGRRTLGRFDSALQLAVREVETTGAARAAPLAGAQFPSPGSPQYFEPVRVCATSKAPVPPAPAMHLDRAGGDRLANCGG